MILRLRIALALQAIGIAIPITATIAYAIFEIAYGLIAPSGPCAHEFCFRPGLLILGLVLFLLGGPLWWVFSGARRAAFLGPRRLAWLVAVNTYLVLAASFVVVAFKETAAYYGAGNVEILLWVVLVPPAVLSTAFCFERIWRLRRRPLKTSS